MLHDLKHQQQQN